MEFLRGPWRAAGRWRAARPWTVFRGRKVRKVRKGRKVKQRSGESEETSWRERCRSRRCWRVHRRQGSSRYRPPLLHPLRSFAFLCVLCVPVFSLVGRARGRPGTLSIHPPPRYDPADFSAQAMRRDPSATQCCGADDSTHAWLSLSGRCPGRAPEAHAWRPNHGA